MTTIQIYLTATDPIFLGGPITKTKSRKASPPPESDDDQPAKRKSHEEESNTEPRDASDSMDGFSNDGSEDELEEEGETKEDEEDGDDEEDEENVEDEEDDTAIDIDTDREEIERQESLAEDTSSIAEPPGTFFCRYFSVQSLFG